MNLADRKSPFAIATTGNLDNRVQRAERPPDDGKVNIHPGFDELGGNHAAGLTGLEAFPDHLNQGKAVMRAHCG